MLLRLPILPEAKQRINFRGDSCSFLGASSAKIDGLNSWVNSCRLQGWRGIGAEELPPELKLINSWIHSLPNLVRLCKTWGWNLPNVAGHISSTTWTTVDAWLRTNSWKAWHKLGICLAYAWHMLGICLAYAWHMLGIRLACWRVSCATANTASQAPNQPTIVWQVYLGVWITKRNTALSSYCFTMCQHVLRANQGSFALAYLATLCLWEVYHHQQWAMPKWPGPDDCWCQLNHKDNNADNNIIPSMPHILIN